MDNIEKGILVGVGGLFMWLIQLIAGKFIERKQTLEKEKLEEMFSDVKDVKTTLRRMEADYGITKEKITVANNRIKDLEDELKRLGEKVANNSLLLAKLEK